MSMELKITGPLYERILADLRRPHAYAAERVGFCSVRQTNAGRVQLLLVDGYRPVADEHYIDDPTVGANIGEPALTAAMHQAYFGRDTGSGVFHVHLHDHRGPTAMSREDRSSIPNVIDGFRQVSPQATHGLIIFSADHAHARAVSLHGDGLELIERVGVIGPRLLTFASR